MTSKLHALTGSLIAVALLAACGGGGGDDAAPTTTAAPSTTVRSTTTTVATTVAATTETSAAPTTTIPVDPVMPLTGLPIVDEVLAARPALVVKIDNHPDARPQSGLNAADIVYEENVEGYTRFAAVFQSQDSDPVGPIRSGRTQDVALLGSLHEPLFAWSGGNPNVTRAIRESDLVELNPTNAGSQGGFFRSRDRENPHDLYASTPKLYTFTPIFAPPPPQQFAYRGEGEAAGGEPASGVELVMEGSLRVDWTWDEAAGVYLRAHSGRAHNDADLGQVNAANVVVIEVEYSPSPADSRSPEAQTVGTGNVLVFTGGMVVRGTWTRADRLDPFTLTDDDGNVIGLTPGRTWVELPRAGKTTPID